MSIGLEMLQVARLAPKVLGEATNLVRDFLRKQQTPSGAFADRGGREDLYYTVFGLESLLALREPVDAGLLRRWLEPFDSGASLDFVHLCCLARCWSICAREEKSTISAALVDRVLERIETFRSKDGGFQNEPGQEFGTVYGCFLASAAFQDLGRVIPNLDGIRACLENLACKDGGWANDRFLQMSSTPGTAAALTLYRQMNMAAPATARDWLLKQRHSQGGFVAMPLAPIPDLLSTATALHALSGMDVPFEEIREPCLDFIDTLWTNEGSFHGHWNDESLDVEYTYYGLLALGHLSV
jgi:prenyltransferase beta subunit